MSVRETIKIGQIEIPKYEFPSNIDEALNAYIRECKIDRGYVAFVDIERPELISDAGIKSDLMRLYAAIRELEHYPDDGFASLGVANALAELEDIEGIRMVLTSLEAAGPLNLYAVWDDDPMFHLAWYLADFKHYDESIESYRKSLTKTYNHGKWVVWTHLGSVYHELGQFERAEQCYQEALTLCELEPKRERFDSSEKESVIRTLLNQATCKQPFTGRRIRHGVKLQPSENS
jgi:tetratricopeptide (TPR) repeat protein